MNGFFKFVIIFLGLVWIIGMVGILLSDAEAVHSSPVVAGAATATTSTDSNSRSFCITTQGDTAVTCPATTYKFNAGEVITLTYNTWTAGAVPPLAPEDVTIAVRENDGNTLVKTLFTGGVPNDGDTFTLRFTHNGNDGGVTSHGVLRLFIRAVRNAIPAYDVDSDTVNEGQAGKLLARMNITTVVRSNYPGAFNYYAYNVSDGDNIGVTFTTTTPYQITSYTVRSRSSCSGVIETDLISSGISSIPTTFQIDDFKKYRICTDGSQAGNQNVTVELECLDTSELSPTDFECEINTVPTGWTKQTDTKMDRTWFNVFAFLNIQHGEVVAETGMVNVEHTLYNRGEVVRVNYLVKNSRSEFLTRSSTTNHLQNGVTIASTTEASHTSIYYSNITLPTTAPALLAFTGLPYIVEWKVAPNHINSTNDPSYSVTRQLLADSHNQLDPTLIKDDFPTPDATEDFAYIVGTNTVNHFAHYKNARNDTNLSVSYTLSIYDPAGDLNSQEPLTTGADGWSSAFTFDASAPAGFWRFNITGIINNNTGFDNETLTFLSSFTGNLIVRVILSPNIDDPSEFVVLARSEKDNNPYDEATFAEIHVLQHNNNSVSVVLTDQMIQQSDLSLWRFVLDLEPGVYSVRVTMDIDTVSIRGMANGVVPMTIQIENLDISGLSQLIFTCILFGLALWRGWIFLVFMSLIAIPDAFVEWPFSFTAFILIYATWLVVMFLQQLSSEGKLKVPFGRS